MIKNRLQVLEKNTGHLEVAFHLRTPQHITHRELLQMTIYFELKKCILSQIVVQKRE